MTDLNKLSTVQEAKDAQYNGAILTRDEEKNIFNDARLKDSSNNVKVSELREVAKLLDKVKKAQAKTKWNEATDQAILNELKKEKTDDTLAGKIVNAAKTVDNEFLLNHAISHLENLKITDSPQDTGIRDSFKAAEDEAKARITEIEKELKDYVELVVNDNNDYNQAKKNRENIEKIIKLMDETELFNVINNNAFFTSANRTKAKAAYDRLKNRKYGGRVENYGITTLFLDLKDIADLMKNVFPYDTLATNPILSNKKLRSEEIVEISWFGLRNLPGDDEFISPATIDRVANNDLNLTKVSAQIGKANGFFRIFWEAFKDRTFLDDYTVALQVASTADDSHAVLRKEKAKSMGKDYDTSGFSGFVFPYDKSTYDLTLYDKFLSAAIIKEKTAKLMSEGDSENFALIQRKLRRAQLEKREAENKKNQAQGYIDRFAGMDLESLKNAFKAIYRIGPPLKYASEEIEDMFSLLVDIKKKETLNIEFAGYEKKLETLRDEIGKFTTISQGWVGMGGTIEDKIAKRSFSTDEVKERELKRIKWALEGIENLRKLGPLEQDDLDSIKEVLEASFTEQLIKNHVGKYAKSTNESKFNDLLAHLKDQGDADGNKNYDNSDDAKKDAAWQEFIKKGPENVVKTIVNHEFEEIKDNDEEKKKITDKMEAAKDGEDRLKKSEYSDDSGNFDEKGIKKFMYEEKVGAKHKFDKKEEDDQTPTPSDKDK
ncbi:13944_t:CDS:2 [Entrophospora sp. SA101]|nr:15475_t:CDS:2 [Entrophospora sp. SA101]CAJ0865828.1 13944_t:CDS:2 [Entrophospora sp. SA101]